MQLSDYTWSDENRTRGFDTWEAEIAHVEKLGYKLAPPDYHIPHWSQAENAPKLYVHGRLGMREMNHAFNRPASDLGYPVFFHSA